MQKNKNGFTMAEILIVLMIVGIIMALSIQAIKIVKASYASLTYFEFNTIKQIAAEMIAGESPNPLLDEFEKDEKVLKLTSTIEGKNGKTLTVINTDDKVFCRAMVSILNTKGKKDCDNFQTASYNTEPYLNIDFNKEKNNFSTTNGRKYYLSKRTQNGNVSDIYGYRLIAVDLNGKSKPNSADTSVRKPPDVVTFLIMDNGEVYPLGAAADNIELPNGGSLQYLNSKLKGYNFDSYYVDEYDEMQNPIIIEAYETDESGNKIGGYRASSAIPSECFKLKSSGNMSCDYGVEYIKNENSVNSKGEKGTLSIFSYRQAFCSSLSKPPAYKKYCENINKYSLCPPVDNGLSDEEKKKKFDLCAVENVKPLFRYDL